MNFSENKLFGVKIKANLDCIPCFQKQILKAVRMNVSDKKIQEKILRKTMQTLLDLDWDLTPPELANIVHGLVKKEMGIEDPYKKVKKECNDIAIKSIPLLNKELDNSDDVLLTALRISIAGNIMDFALNEGQFDIKKTIEDVLKKKFAIDNYLIFKEKIYSANSLLLFTDNSGEIVFDKLLLETILKVRKEKNLGELKITVAVKGGPIINDATLEDVKYIKLDKISKINFKTISNGLEGTGPVRNSPMVEEWINEHDVVISKGQGNYEGLSKFKNVFFMLIAKCKIIANDLNVNQGDIILKYSN